MQKELNIYQRIQAITSSIKNVEKNLTVGSGNIKYKAVGEADVLREVRKAEQENGVLSFPFNREIVFQDIVEKKTSNGVKTEYVIRIKTVYRFINIDKPEEFIEVTSFSDGMDSGDKACGKAMTYGDKYALLKAYKIPTGEDPDADPSETGKVTKQITRSDMFNRILKLYTSEQVEEMMKRLNVTKLQDLDDETLRKMAKL